MIAVIDAEIMCGVLPARPALTMVKYSSRLAVAAEASSGMWGTLLLSIRAPVADIIL